MAWTTLGATLTSVAYLNLKAPAYAEAPVYAGTVEGKEFLYTRLELLSKYFQQI